MYEQKQFDKSFYINISFHKSNFKNAIEKNNSMTYTYKNGWTQSIINN